MYPNRKFRTRLPTGFTPSGHDFEELYRRDLEKKMQMKCYADNKRNIKTSDFQIGNSVLVRRQAVNKATPAYETEPLQVQNRKGTRVMAKRTNDSTITRITAYFKRVPYRSTEEPQQWSTSDWTPETVSESTFSTRKDGCPGLEQSEETTTGRGAEESIHAEVGMPTNSQSPQVSEEGGRRSERHRKDTDTYLKEKYQDFQL